MAQLRVISFNRGGLGLAGSGEMVTGVVDQGVVDRMGVRVIVLSLRRAVKQGWRVS